MRVIRAAECRRMPWKNGGGETVEIAISPEGAGLDDFDWRLSMARVESDGPFSLFTGVERTLAILEGAGLVLSVRGQGPVRLTDRSAPFAFPADLETSSSLIAGPITDLNMMTRRGGVSHSMRRLMARDTATPAVEADEILLFCRSGAVEVGSDASLHLGPLDTLHMRKAPEALQIKAIEPAELFLVEIAKLFRPSAERSENHRAPASGIAANHEKAGFAAFGSPIVGVSSAPGIAARQVVFFGISRAAST